MGKAAGEINSSLHDITYLPNNNVPSLGDVE